MDAILKLLNFRLPFSKNLVSFITTYEFGRSSFNEVGKTLSNSSGFSTGQSKSKTRR